MGIKIIYNTGIGTFEERIILYLREERSEYDVLNDLSPKRKADATHWASTGFHKTRLTVNRLMSKGVVEKNGYKYRLTEKGAKICSTLLSRQH